MVMKLWMTRQRNRVGEDKVVVCKTKNLALRAGENLLKELAMPEHYGNYKTKMWHHPNNEITLYALYENGRISIDYVVIKEIDVVEK